MRLYVSGADSGELSVLALDPATGAVETLQTVAGLGQVMPLGASPDGRFLYAVRRSEPFAVLGFAIDAASGRLRPNGEAPLPVSMAHVATDMSGRWLFTASYHGDRVAVGPIDALGRPQPVSQVVPTAPKAHAMRATADNRFVFAACLGGDLVAQFRFDAATGMLSANDPPQVASKPGAGPRHLAFHPDGRLVAVLNELDASVDLYALDPERGTLERRDTASALPDGFAAGEPWGAEIRFTPDGRFVYATERRSSTIAGFAVDAAAARLAKIGQWPTQAQPRGMAVDPTGRFVVVAGQQSHRVGVHRIDAADGRLALVGEHPVGRNPTWVEAIALGPVMPE